MRWLLLALLLGEAHAAGSWERMEPSPGVSWEYDTASIVVLPNNQRRILVRQTYSGIKKDPNGNHWDHAVMLVELDCDKRLRRVVDSVLYLRAERVQPSRTTDDWKPIGDTSILHKAACEVR